MGTPQPSLRSSPESITSSILCTPREPSSIGTSVRVWRKVSSPRPEKILPPLRRITKRSESRPPKVKARKKVWSDPYKHEYYLFVCFKNTFALINRDQGAIHSLL